MKNTANYLDELQDQLGVESDYALGKMMGWHRQHVSQYRTLKTTFNDETCLRVADMLDTDPAYVITCMHVQREKNMEVKKVWERIAAMASSAVMTVFVAVIVSALVPNNSAIESGIYTAVQSVSNIHYAHTMNIK